MGSFLFTTVLLFGFLVLQTTLVPLIAVKQITPDLLLLFVVLRGVREGRTRVVILGFISGLLQDLAGTGPVGILALSRTVAVFAACSLPINRYEKNLWMVGAVLLAASIIEQILYSGLVGGESALGMFGMVFRYGLPSAFYTFILGWIWAFAVSRLRNRPGERER